MSKNLKRFFKIGLASLAFLLVASGTSVASHASRVSTVTQRSNALTSYISSSNLRFVHNRRYVEPNDYSDHYNRNENYDRRFNSVGGNQRVNFSPYGELPDNYNSLMKNEGYHNPQSLVITKNGTAYVTYRVNTHGIKLVQFNIKAIQNAQDDNANNHVHYKIGPTFNGGHGQAMAYNPKANQLWLLTNDSGSASRTSILQLSQKTLKPIRKINFHFDTYAMPDVLTFDNAGHAYTAMRTFGGVAPVGSLKLFKGSITNRSVKFHMVQGLRYAPGLIMQNMSYNPSNHRIYFITDGELMSVPANRYTHLRPRDVKATKLSGHYEFEDLAFYRHRGYLMVHCPPELMISNHNF